MYCILCIVYYVLCGMYLRREAPVGETKVVYAVDSKGEGDEEPVGAAPKEGHPCVGECHKDTRRVGKVRHGAAKVGREGCHSGENVPGPARGRELRAGLERRHKDEKEPDKMVAQSRSANSEGSNKGRKSTV